MFETSLDIRSLPVSTNGRKHAGHLGVWIILSHCTRCAEISIEQCRMTPRLAALLVACEVLEECNYTRLGTT